MCLVNRSGRNVCISNQGVLSVSKFQVFRSRNQLTPGAHKLPFWCGEDRRAGPNTDVPAESVQTQALGCAVSPGPGGRTGLGSHLWGTAGSPLALLAQGYLVRGHHSGGGAADSMEKVLSNRVLRTEILRCADPYIYL